MSRHFREWRFRLFYWLLRSTRTDLLRLGGECAWTIAASKVSADSFVVCAGAGNDISFEKGLIDRFGCQVALLDPSPTGSATMQREGDFGGKLMFLNVGLAERDGPLAFAAPEDQSEGSFRIADEPLEATVKFDCVSLQTVLQKFGRSSIDLLKVDIEGSEYGVIDSLLRSKVPVQQLCVEFHHRPPFAHTPLDTARTILRLRMHGMRLVHHIHFDHTFVR
jgi:FkbM family methyltransferase